MARSVRYHPRFDSDVLAAADSYDQRQLGLGSDFLVRVRNATLAILADRVSDAYKAAARSRESRVRHSDVWIMSDSLPRLRFVFACEAPVCVILRRGPSRWVHLVKWNTADDTIERGAWFRGRIHDDGCDLSPDGRLLVYFATRYDRVPADGYSVAWTAVSKPPWMTALAMWPRDDSWGGRAYFANNTTVVIDCPHWERLVAHEDHQPGELNAITRWIGRGAPQQEVPTGPQKAAYFEASEGRDQAGNVFRVLDGQLLRESHGIKTLIADFRFMHPERTSSPRWARKW